MPTSKPAIRFPGQVEAMEAASNELWRQLQRLTVPQLKALRPTGLYVGLIDALIDVRSLMDGGTREMP